MGLSTFSIHMATLQWQGSSPSENVVFSLLIQLIRGPIIVTCVIFKTGTLALVFSTLKYGGIIIAALWMVPAMLIFIQLIREKDDEGLYREKTTKALQASLMNIITIVFFDDGDRLFKKRFVRRLYYSGVVFNSVTLGLCYFLTRRDPCHKTCSYQCDDGANWTFHWSETNGWLRENLDIAAGLLIAVGLLSCILFEIFNCIFPCCMDTEDDPYQDCRANVINTLRRPTQIFFGQKAQTQ